MTPMLVNIEPQELSLLEPSNNAGYGRLRLPSSRDEEIGSFVRRLWDPEVFLSATRSLDPRHGAVLAAYAERMASLAVRTGSRDVLHGRLLGVQLALAVGYQRAA